MRVMSPQDWIEEVQAMGDDAPDDAKTALDFALRHQAIDVAGRRAILRFASVLCQCARWYDRDVSFPQQDCPVHAVVMVTLDNQLL